MKNEKCNSSHPLSGDTAEMISLWQTSFHDSDKFASLFFSRVYKSENTLVIKNEGKIVSALQMIPYKIKTNAGIIPSAYVCGVCTLTSERGKGNIKTLMREATDDMRQKGYGIATLIPSHPWLFDIYKKFGYVHPIYYSLERYSCKDNPCMPYTSCTLDKSPNNSSDYTFTPYSEKYFPYFDKKQQERKCTVIHNKHDIENIIRDLKIDNGNAWMALHKNIPVGIAFANPASEEDVIIKEILYDTPQAKEKLINHILNTHNIKTANLRIPPNKTSTNPHLYGLACILDKQIFDIEDLYMTLMLD